MALLNGPTGYKCPALELEQEAGRGGAGCKGMPGVHGRPGINTFGTAEVGISSVLVHIRNTSAPSTMFAKVSF